MAKHDDTKYTLDTARFDPQLDAYLRTTEGLPLGDDEYAWLVRTFPSCPRPPAINHSDDEAFRRDRGSRGREGGRKRRTAVDTVRAGGGDTGGARAGSKLDLCLTRHGFVEMYRCIWQAAGRDLEVKKHTYIAGVRSTSLASLYRCPFLLSADRYLRVCLIFERALLLLGPSRGGEGTTWETAERHKQKTLFLQL